MRLFPAREEIPTKENLTFIAQMALVPGSVYSIMRNENREARAQGNEAPNGLLEYSLLATPLELFKVAALSPWAYMAYQTIDKFF